MADGNGENARLLEMPVPLQGYVIWSPDARHLVAQTVEHYTTFIVADVSGRTEPVKITATATAGGVSWQGLTP